MIITLKDGSKKEYQQPMSILDIASDITVMENLLKQEGLADEKPFAAGG